MLNHPPTLNRIFHALADPTRRAIVERLTRGETPVSELAEPHDMSLAAIVQHVRILEDCGVIRTQKTGRVRTCRVEAQTLSLAERWLSQRRGLWEARLDRLGLVLAQKKKAAQIRKPKV